MSENCPVCQSLLIGKRPGSPYISYDCHRCGRFSMHDHAEDTLQRIYLEANDEKENKTAILSYSIRKMQKNDANCPARIDKQLIETILKRPLPSITEQANNLIIWLAENSSPGEDSSIETITHQSIAGSINHKCFKFILEHLFNLNLLDHKQRSETASNIGCLATLTFDGWQHHEQLQRGAIDSRKAFMAMEYGDEELDEIVDDYFKPAVDKTGFELIRLNENPKGGSIDDRLRVEIRNSRFLISDLTHDNNGAYWEAGYAEGLGKPVIYTCKDEKFDKEKTHFDTNHHLTVKWNPDKIDEAVEMLKATIRATLPDEAKLSDG